MKFLNTNRLGKIVIEDAALCQPGEDFVLASALSLFLQSNSFLKGQGEKP